MRRGRELGGGGAGDVSGDQGSQGLEAVVQAGLALSSGETASWAPRRPELGTAGHRDLAEKCGFCRGTALRWPTPAGSGSSHPEGTGGVGPRQEPDFVTRIGLALSPRSELRLQLLPRRSPLLPDLAWGSLGAMDPRSEWAGVWALGPGGVGGAMVTQMGLRPSLPGFPAARSRRWGGGVGAWGADSGVPREQRGSGSCVC